MNNKCIFEMLVYRLSPEKRETETAKTREAERRSDPFARPENVSTEDQSELRRIAELRFALSYEGRPWKYNDVVGYIAIFVDKLQITAEYWLAEGRISRNMGNRIIRHRDKVFELWVTESSTTQILQEKIKIELERLKSRWPFKGRYIDTTVFDAISPSVNWKALTES